MTEILMFTLNNPRLAILQAAKSSHSFLIKTTLQFLHDIFQKIPLLLARARREVRCFQILALLLFLFAFHINTVFILR